MWRMINFKNLRNKIKSFISMCHKKSKIQMNILLSKKGMDISNFSIHQYYVRNYINPTTDSIYFYLFVVCGRHWIKQSNELYGIFCWSRDWMSYGLNNYEFIMVISLINFRTRIQIFWVQSHILLHSTILPTHKTVY